jgi:hypothetical protein
MDPTLTPAVVAAESFAYGPVTIELTKLLTAIVLVDGLEEGLYSTIRRSDDATFVVTGNSDTFKLLSVIKKSY